MGKKSRVRKGKIPFAGAADMMRGAVRCGKPGGEGLPRSSNPGKSSYM
jgi:hypothetical protein